MFSTLSYSDLYGATPPGRKVGDVSGQPSAAASGPVKSTGKATVANLWVGLILAFVLLRVAWEVAEEK